MTSQPSPIPVEWPRAFQGLFGRARYKGYYGGRGGAKSWAVARALLIRARAQSNMRVLCTREYQTSIRDSVHQVLKTQVSMLGFDGEFDVTEAAIRHRKRGSEFIFKGLRHDVQGIKSLEGIDVAWVEEAQSVSADSLVVLDPTIRKDGSEVWFTFNPDQTTDPVYAWLVDGKPPEGLGAIRPGDAVVRRVTWRDNPWFPPVLERQREAAEALAKATGDWDAYNWIWEGLCRRISDALVFRRRVVVEEFATPAQGGIDAPRFFHGADWGFANDPTALVRCWMTTRPDGKHLWIDQEAFGHGVEIDETPALFDRIPTARKWPIKADNSRPETISYVKRAGFNVGAAEKWQGSVEDGIAYLKGFACIHIHERCKNIVEESKLYSYKRDKQTGEVLPVLVDAHNHGWDAVRYALDGYITATGFTIPKGAMEWSRAARRK